MSHAGANDRDPFAERIAAATAEAARAEFESLRALADRLKRIGAGIETLASDHDRAAVQDANLAAFEAANAAAAEVALSRMQRLIGQIAQQGAAEAPPHAMAETLRQTVEDVAAARASETERLVAAIAAILKSASAGGPTEAAQGPNLDEPTSAEPNPRDWEPFEG